MKENEVIEGLDERCHDCGGSLPMGKGCISFYCRLIGLCRYCYQHKYPMPKPRPEPTQEERENTPLSYNQRRASERAGFNEEVWSPEFRAEWLEYWEAKMRGEI